MLRIGKCSASRYLSVEQKNVRATPTHVRNKKTKTSMMVDGKPSAG